MGEIDKKRKVYIDFLKIIAIYMVMFNHTYEKGYLLFAITQGSNWYPVYLFCSIFIKIAVPLFFMASGALLLGKEESYKDLLCKRFFKYFLILLMGSFIAYLYQCLRLDSEKVSIQKFFTQLYTKDLTVAYWYLYAYLAFILMLPLLRKLAKAMTDQEYKWMFFMFGIIKMLPILDFLIWQGNAEHNSNFSFFISSDTVFYPLMGFYLDQRMKKEDFTLKKLLILSGMSVAVITVCGLLTNYKCTLTGEWGDVPSQTFFKTLIFIPSITVYYGVKMWFMNHELNGKLCDIIAEMGKATFGIFLFEQICRHETKFVFYLLEPYIHTFPACCIWILVACICGMTVVLGVRKLLIPKILKRNQRQIR